MPDLSSLSAEPVRVAVTMGDPLGIGPEIIVRAVVEATARGSGRDLPVLEVFAAAGVLEAAAEGASLGEAWSAACAAGRVRVHSVKIEPADEREILARFGRVPVGGTGVAPPRGPSASGGRASLACIDAAVRACLGGRANALVTAPISKTSWSGAGERRFPGHTELLAHLCRAHAGGGCVNTGPAGAPESVEPSMVFVGPRLRVALVTIHEPLSRVAALVTREAVARAVRHAAETCARLGLGRARIGVCGLNPHAGEGGLLGAEDDAVIRPGVEDAKASGIDARGPLPADALFPAADAGEYDAVVAMYHDQGLIPCKLLDRWESVNLTLGLPIIRTSPAHGTAFDIAAPGPARATPPNADSMRAAIRLAARLAQTDLLQ